LAYRGLKIVSPESLYSRDQNSTAYRSVIPATKFLRPNSKTLSFSPREALAIAVALAAGELAEHELADWFRPPLAAG